MSQKQRKVFVEVSCDFCGLKFQKYIKKLSKHNFCGLSCKNAYASRVKNPKGYADYRDLSKASEHMRQLNTEMNPERMTPEVREKLRRARLDTGAQKSYRKVNGRHEHRVVAEQILGRKLLPGEVVHHIDRNQRNNAPENLMIFPSQAEHARWHKLNDSGNQKGGDAV